MKLAVLFCCFSLSMVAMDNNNPKNHFAYENDSSYIACESAQDKYSCILHISSNAYEEKSDMTFVHKKGIPVDESNAFNMLDTNEKHIVQQMEKSTLVFLQTFFLETWGTLSAPDSASCKFRDMQFKKPQVRIIKKELINLEKNGIFGEYVNTNFLRVKVDSKYSLIYSTEPKKERTISLYFYVSNNVNGLELFPYKAKLVGSYIQLHADKQVRYF